MNLSYLLLDLCFDQKVKLSHILHPEFDLAFNVDSQNSTIKQREQAIQLLLKDNLLTYSNIDDYLELTNQGGVYWESIFYPNWDLYFELSYMESNHQSMTYFYATQLATIIRLIELSNGLLKNVVIKKANHWQPIYWKSQFNGYYFESDDNDDVIVPISFLLPDFKNYSLFS